MYSTLLGATTRTWQDGTSKTLYQKKKSSEGKRFMICHAGSRGGFLEDGLVFSTKNKSADYHDNMNAELFEQWFEESVLMKLETPTVIILDNASYHSRKSEPWPTGSWRKEELVQWLDRKNIPHAPNLMKAELLEIIKGLNKPQQEHAVDGLANSYGHRVLRLPPYHCEFNAIEMIWGIAKTHYNKNIAMTNGTDDDVERLWTEALQSITADVWSKTIDKVNLLIRQALKNEHLVDDVRPLIITDYGSEDDSDEESDSDDDSDRVHESGDDSGME